MTESFVFYKSFFDALKELDADTRLRFYDAITEYGLTGKNPDFTGIEKALWIQIQIGIDNAKERYIKSVENGKKGGRPKTEEKPEETQNNLEKPNETLRFSENNLEKPNHNLNVDVDVNDNVDVDANENVNVNENVNEDGECSGFSLSFAPEAQKDFARQIFDKFSKADLPCWNNNFTSFIQADFKNTVKIRQGINSNDILQAVDNYITEIQSSDSYLHGGGMTFQAFCESRLFNQMLPQNYRHNLFVKNRPKENEKPRNLIDLINEVLHEEADNPAFNPSILYDHQQEWQAQGQPHGPDYYEWQNKFLSEYGEQSA